MPLGHFEPRSLGYEFLKFDRRQTARLPVLSIENRHVLFILFRRNSSSREERMDEHCCPKCNKLLMAMTDRTGLTEASLPQVRPG